MPNQAVASKWTYKVDGAPIAPDLQARLSDAVIEQHLLLPDTCVLTFEDTAGDLGDPASGATFPLRIGSKLEVSVADLSSDNASPEPLFTGEITTIGARFFVTLGFLVVEAYDLSHRLHRGRKTRAFVNKTEADIIRDVAGGANVDVGTLDPSLNGDLRKHVAQADMSDWEFIKGRANELGLVASVISGKLEVRPPDAPGTPVEIELGKELHEFHPRVSGVQQVGQVQVRAWDPVQKQVNLGTSQITDTAFFSAEQPQPNTAFAAGLGSLGATSSQLVWTLQPVANQGDAQKVADAIKADLTSSFAEAYGVAEGNSDIRAGCQVKVSKGGWFFSGTWRVTMVRHQLHLHEGGYLTEFECTGNSDRSLLGLASNGATQPEPGGRRFHGAVVGIVTAVKDDRGEGTGVAVKVKFPSLDDSAESTWGRLVAPGGGNERGVLLVPEVGDEVVVLFEAGDMRRPLIIGGLYNGVDKPPVPMTEYVPSDKIEKRTFKTRIGSHLTFVDESGKEALTLEVGKDGKWTFVMDKGQKKLSVGADGKVEITATDDITITSDKGITLEAKQGDIKLKASTGKVDMQSNQLGLKANADAKLEGAQVTIQGSGPTAVKGSPLALN